MSHRLFALVFAPACVLAAGCTDSAGTTISGGISTTIVVEPSAFLGDGVACSPNPGALQAYVVTLTAWSGDSAPFVLGSSFPTPCALGVQFRNLVIAGNVYTAEIDAYDRAAVTLAPWGSASGGARQMTDAATGDIVPPRWTTRCGHGPSDGVLAEASSYNFITECDPLVDSAPSTTAVSLAPSDALGADPCSRAASFDVASPELPPATDIACDAAPLIYAADAGRGYHFYVAAKSDTALASADLGAECFAQAVVGQTVPAECAPLAADGGARLDAPALDGNGLPLCSAGRSFVVSLAGEVLTDVPVACGQSALVSPLAPGDYSFDLVVRDEGATVGAATCVVAIRPGKTTTAVCTVP